MPAAQGSLSSDAAKDGGPSNAKKPAVFVCEICRSQGLDARYSRIEYLNRHERTHTETKPFQCEHCQKRYARSDVLFRHRRKCQMNTSNAAGSDGNASPDEATGPAPFSRTKGREEASRPYPTLSDENAGASQTKPSARHGIAGDHTGYYQNSDTLFSGDQPIPSELLPSLNGNVLLPQGITVNDLHPFYPDGLSQPNINEIMHDLDFPESHPFPPYQEGQTKSAFSSALASHFRYGGNEPLPWEEDASTDSPPSDTATDLIEPELTMLSSELEICRQKCGPQTLDSSNPFFFDPSRMMYCYMVDKWHMPTATKMSALAYRTYNHVMEHLGIFHMPTFRLNDAHVWVSFAMCTSNSIDPSIRKAPVTDVGNHPQIQQELKELSESSIWVESQKVIQREKTELILNAIYNSQKLTKLTPDEALPLIHALLLYNSKSFLSDNACERLSGEAYLATITTIASTSGIFNPGSDCLRPAMFPTKDWDRHWKEWITHESWRRTAWLVFTLDTIASLDKGAKSNLPIREVRHIPLPYSNILWKASNAGEWCTGMTDLNSAGLTLEGAMTCHTKPSKDGIPLYKRRIGPFARHIMVLVVLRGIVEYGTGKPRGGYITKRWVVGTAKPGTVPTERLALHDWIISKYSQMLDYWRRGWDLDTLCHTNYRGVHFVNDALPPYWLCRALLDRLSPPPPTHVPEVVYCMDDNIFEEDGPNRLSDVNLREMFHTARQFVSHGEGLGEKVSTYAPVDVQETQEQEQHEQAVPMSVDEPSVPPMAFPPMNDAPVPADRMRPEPMMPPMANMPDPFADGAWSVCAN